MEVLHILSCTMINIKPMMWSLTKIMICTLNNKPSLSLNRFFMPDIPETATYKPLNVSNIKLNISNTPLDVPNMSLDAPNMPLDAPNLPLDAPNMPLDAPNMSLDARNTPLDGPNKYL